MNNSSCYIIPGLKFRPESNFNRMVCEIFHITEEQIKLKTRRHTFLVPRQTAMTLYRLHTNKSCHEIGAMYNRDEATVHHSLKTVRDTLLLDKHYKQKIEPIRELLNFKKDPTNKNF